MRLGEYVVYECTRRNEFFEIPMVGFVHKESSGLIEFITCRLQVGPEIQTLCKNPVTDLEGTIDPMTSWPTCEQRPCKCLGQGNGLNMSEALEVLQTSCPSSTTYELMEDATGMGYVIPRRYNCGTRTPEMPTWESRCECPDLGESKNGE